MFDTYGKNAQASRLFDGIARNYERPAELFSFFQYGRWRRFLVSRLILPSPALVLDVCTGTGLVARDIARLGNCRVIGVDLAKAMIGEAQRNLETQISASDVSLVQARAESLPFVEESFDAVVFTYLLRYVEDPPKVLRELARVVRPGGQLISLEFSVPENAVLHRLWLLYTHLVLPLGARLLSPQWKRVGSFLGPSISAFHREHPPDDLREMWASAGLAEVRWQTLTFGGALAIWGRKQAHAQP